MFDHNNFKRSVKEWVRQNPKASVNDVLDFCEDQIPSQLYVVNKWLVDQTVEWYKHILNNKKATEEYPELMDDEC